MDTPVPVFIDRTECLSGDIVNHAGWQAAIEALMMDDPHPKGYLSGTPASRLSRALYAYEWAKRECPMIDHAEGRWQQSLPDPETVRAAVLAREAAE